MSRINTVDNWFGMHVAPNTVAPLGSPGPTPGVIGVVGLPKPNCISATKRPGCSPAGLTVTLIVAGVVPPVLSNEIQLAPTGVNTFGVTVNWVGTPLAL